MCYSRSTVLIALGGNLSSGQRNPAQTLIEASASLNGHDQRISALSRFFRTPCYPVGAGPDYVNAAAILQSELSPEMLLDRLHAIENAFGRERAQRWGRRTLDLDVLAIGDLVRPDAALQTRWRTLPPEEQIAQTPDQLVLPHPRLQDRGFVLVPLADIAPSWVHPLTGKSVVQMLATLPAEQRAGIAPL